MNMFVGKSKKTPPILRIHYEVSEAERFFQNHPSMTSADPNTEEPSISIHSKLEPNRSKTVEDILFRRKLIRLKMQKCHNFYENR